MLDGFHLMRQVSNYHRGVDDHCGETENNHDRVGRGC